MPFPYGGFVGSGAGGGTAAFLGSGGGSSFLNTFGAGLAGGFAQSFGTALGSQLLGEEGFNKSDLAYSHHKDIETYKRIRNSNFRFQTKKGLNSYEALMGPQGGGETGPTASGQVLGNAQTAEMQQDRADARAAFQAGLDRQMQLRQTQMQTDAQRDVAKIQAGVNIRGQDIDKQIAENTFGLSKRRLEADLKQMAKQLEISDQELLYKINQVATSNEKFLTAMKQLSMGPANLLAELTMRHHGISLSDKKFQNMSEAQRKEIINEIVALGAKSYVELSGVGSFGSEIYDRLVNILKVLGINISPGIEPTDIPVPQLGNQMAGPFKTGPDMNMR